MPRQALKYSLEQEPKRNQHRNSFMWNIAFFRNNAMIKLKLFFQWQSRDKNVNFKEEK